MRTVAGGVVMLGGTEAAPDTLGGKGASLDRMVARGYPIPPAAVITTSAYAALVEDPALRTFLNAIASSTAPPSADAVEEAFASVTVPIELADEIVAAAAALGPRIAVRSSATAEDRSAQSFAGQYRSYLDVPTNDPPRVLEAVRRVWASLWMPAPWSYRRAWAIPDDDVAMAVVLMAMVPAEQAGVVFTHDPGGSTDRLRVEVVEGLAESLVSGARTPAVWLVSRDPDVPVPADGPPALDSLRSLALALERDEGGRALDIEWAWDGTTTWLVQSRPVTVAALAHDGFDTAVDDHELTTAGIGEMLPGVFPPLRWEVNSFLVDEALRRTLDALGALDVPGLSSAPFVRRVRGRAALDLDQLKQAAATIPGSSADDIERQYFGSSVPAGPSTEARAGRLRVLGRDLRALSARRSALMEAQIVIDATDRIMAEVPDLSGLDDSGLFAYRLRLIDLAVRGMTAELAVAAAAGAAYARLERTVAQTLGEVAAASWAQRVTRGAGLPPRPFPGSSRSVFAGPRWDELDDAPTELRAKGAEAEAHAARMALEAELSANPRWRRTRVLTGQFVDVRLRVLRRLISDAADDLGLREDTKAAVLALGGEVRRVHLELGRRLRDRGLLPTADDVELLCTAELREASAAGRLATALVGRRRRWIDRCEGEEPLPDRFTGVPTSTPPPLPTGDVLTGRAASGGRHTGLAVVVDDPAGARLPRGSVLVARATDAAWSPLFLRAGALVVERGGPLSHAAIVARELGVPAVLDVTGATGVLDGRIVTVDGDRGVVVLETKERSC